jgi:hypothetical protein
VNGLPAWLRRWTGSVCAAGCLLFAVPALGQVDGSQLWTKLDMPPSVVPAAEAVTTIAVDVNLGVLRSAERLVLTLPDGEKLIAIRSRRVETPKGFVWSGTIEHQAIGTASFSVVNETITGSILSGKGKSFRLRRHPSGVYLLEEIDLRKVPPEGKPAPISGVRGDNANDPALDTCTTDSGDDIDVMVVYTADALAGAGSADAIESDIYLAVDQANQSYINSNIAQRLRLVHIAEVSYVESGNSTTDRDAVQGGLIPTVNSLRASHGADVVALITEALNLCGQGFTMDPVGNAFQDHAFAVVRRACMSLSGKHTLAHELGHLMSAEHDWDDNTFTSPYPYMHGHVEASPSAGSPWRTVMAVDTHCTSGCPRVLNWSNPNVSIGGIPTGAASGIHQQDNHRTLNNTARTVANFRCSSPARSDTWMKDTWGDTGAEPDSAQAGQPMWESPYIWVRNSQDTLLTHQHEHENPISGQTNFIYVKLHNGGATSGNLEIRVANATVGLAWPGGWTMLPSGPMTIALPAATTRIVEVPWTPQSAGHFCLLARWDSVSDPMTTPESGDIEANVRGNNNIVWRNVQLIDLGGDESSVGASFEIPGVGDGRNFVLAIRPVPPRHSPGPIAPGFTDFGRITLTLDDRLMDAWKRNAYQSTGLRREGNTITVTDPRGAQLILGDAAGPARAHIKFSRPNDGSYPRDEFGWRVIQSSIDGQRSRIGGGITYQVRTFAP